MKKRILSIVLSICMILSMLPLSASAAETPVVVTVTGTEDHTQAAGVVELVNESREENDLEPMTRNATLSELAMQRAAEIALYYESGHLRPDDSACSTIIEGVYTGWTQYGENIAIGQRSDADVMEDWLNSAGHRANILDESFTQIGVGCFYAGGTYCWVQLFGNSTTNTAETSATGSVPALREVSILPANLDLSPAGSQKLVLEEDASTTLTITSTNPGFTYTAPALIPEAADMVADEDGLVIASVSITNDGTITISAVNPGTGTLELPVYDGQSDPLTLEVTVSDGETTPPETTKPEETEPPETTEPDETVPPETTEPDETEPPETTEPDETEPPETTEPDETEPPETTEPPEPDPDADASGYWGDNLVWKLEDTTLTISGKGAMDEEVNGETTFPWATYQNTVTHLIIEDGVTTISDYAFNYFHSLMDVQLPDTLKSIGYRGFSSCESLTEIDLPDSITAMDGNVFGLCTRLTTVRLPANITTIPGSMFWGAGLTQIEIPDSVTVIGAEAFRGCENLKQVTLPSGVTSIQDWAFSGCTSLTSINLPHGLTEISWGAFHDTGLTSIQIPSSVTTIESYGFDSCTALEKAIIPDSVVNCYGDPFNNCPNLVIHCYELSYIHRYAEENSIAVSILAEDPKTPVYPITAYSTGGGTVTLSTESSPANRYVLVSIKPDEGCYVNAIYYYYDSEEELDLQFEQVSDTELVFFMPACEVVIEVYFNYVESPFDDVKETDYFYEPVLWAVNNGITSGISDHLFGPNNSCTRAQVVTFLWRAAGSPEPETSKNPFTDVKESDYFYKAVLWAVENGITAGVSDTKFGSTNNCTRAQVVTFLWRACASPDPKTSNNPFTDVKSSDYYYKAVLWAVENGITSGMSATKFGSSNTCTRGQIVTFLFKTVNG